MSGQFFAGLSGTSQIPIAILEGHKLIPTKTIRHWQGGIDEWPIGDEGQSCVEEHSGAQALQMQ